ITEPSNDHDGSASIAASLVRSVNPDPSALATQRSTLPSAVFVAMNASFDPSGDHAGEERAKPSDARSAATSPPTRSTVESEPAAAKAIENEAGFHAGAEASTPDVRSRRPAPSLSTTATDEPAAPALWKAMRPLVPGAAACAAADVRT